MNAVSLSTTASLTMGGSTSAGTGEVAYGLVSEADSNNLRQGSVAGPEQQSESRSELSGLAMECEVWPLDWAQHFGVQLGPAVANPAANMQIAISKVNIFQEVRRDKESVLHY